MPGYFVGLATIISFLLWRIFGREKRNLLVASIFPPKGLTPVDVGYIMNGRFNNTEEIISLILFWAEKGYLHISEIIGKKELQLHKVRNPDADANLDERSRFADMFSRKNVVQATDSIRYLTNTYSMSINPYEKPVSMEYFPKLLLVGAPSFICFWGLLFNKFLLDGGTWFETAMVTTFIISICVAGFVLILCGARNSNERESAFIFIMMLALMCTLFELDSSRTIKAVLLRILEMVDLLIPLYLMTKYTIKMRSKLERENIACLEGFKNFLGSDSMSGPTESQEYFYHVLPYAMVLGMTDALVKKFEHVALYPPKWYKSSSPEKTISASSFVSRLLEGL